MASFMQDIEVNMIIKEVNIQNAAKKKIDDLTRVRLGLPAVGPVAFPAGSREATAKAMGAAGVSGQAGAMGMAGSLGGLLGGIAGLTAILSMMVENSKIIKVIMSTIGKALGLLVDVILMPFLPLIMVVLIGLFKAIMEFYKIWKSFVTPEVIKAIKDIGDVLKLGLKGLFDLTLGAAITAGEYIWNFLKWLWEVMTTGDKGTVKFKVDVLGKLNEGLEWIRGGWAKIVVTISEVILAPLVAKLAGGVNWLGEGFKNLTGIGISDRDIWGPQPGDPKWDTSNPKGDFMPDMKFESGGVVPRTGPALVHKGETVIPKGAKASNITVNITGQFKSDEDMYRKFVDRLRQEQWRTNV